MAKKIKLESTYSFDDINIIGINTSMPDYKLIWNINNTFTHNLIKRDDFNFEMLKTAELIPFSFYQYHDMLNNKWIYLLSNKTYNKYLIPEYKTFNYLFIIKGISNDSYINAYLSKLKSIKNVIMCNMLDLKKIKFLDVIITDFELFTIELNKKKK